jgi:micrococcal nuclease
MAWWFHRYAPSDADLARLENEAKASRIGLWSQPNPAAPWNWRHGDGVPLIAGVIGNRRSHVYHKPNCRGTSAMKEPNRVTFASEAEAEKAGYLTAGDCR